MECDSAHDQAGVVRQDYRAQLRATTVGRWCSLEFDRVFSRRQFVRSAQTDLECQEEELADDRA
jgi:hypothetical protein